MDEDQGTQETREGKQMIYSDHNTIRIQKSNLRYLVFDETYFLIHKTLHQMHLDFPDNKPIGPTSLVEWQE